MKSNCCMSTFNTEYGVTRRRRVSVYSGVGLLILLALACGQPPPGQGAGEIESSATNQVSFRVETVVAGLQVPWSIAWAPDGRMFFTERPGRVRVVVNGQLRSQPLIVLTDVEPSGESGLMSLALHPQFSVNHFLYLSYAYKGASQLVRVVRYRESEAGLTDRQVIIENIPAAQYHAGCRLGFGPDGKLYITTGDATERGLAQKLDSLAGKTLRLNDDGTVPTDNPFVGQPNARPEIWSLGHRNASGNGLAARNQSDVSNRARTIRL